MEWTVTGVLWKGGNRKIKARSFAGDRNQVFTLANFITWGGRPSLANPPEPEKSEAEKLFQSVRKGDTFWAGNDGEFVKWVVCEGATNGRSTVRAHAAGYPNGPEYGFDCESS